MPDHDTEHVLGQTPLDDGYWQKEANVFFGHELVRGADAPTFRWWTGGFAKDRNHCYCQGRPLVGGNAATFRALNFCYATDGTSVWTIGGRVDGADAATFVVCDDGAVTLRHRRAPHGFGKDAAHVWYYDFDGEPNRLRKADPATFVSLGDGTFGRDAETVFCGRAAIAKANAATWRKLGGNYSIDDRRVFYWNRVIEGADVGTFEVVPDPRVQLAKDARRLYWNDVVVDAARFAEMQKGPPPRR